MKRVFAVAAVFMLLLSSAIAEINLSNMSVAQLIALKEQINNELMSRPQIKSVTVPQGLWVVGKDIPAGTYTLKCPDLGRDEYLMRHCDIQWGKSTPNDGIIKSKDRLGKVEIFNDKNNYYKGGQTTEYVVTFENGTYIYIHPLNNKVIFTTYTGNPDLGFDW